MTVLSLIIVLFFSICLFQPLAHSREDWPFSFFGMYQGLMSPRDVYRVDIDILMNTGKVISAFDMHLNFYYLQDVLDKNISSPKDLEKPDLPAIMSHFFEEDIIPVMRANKILDEAKEIRLRYRLWKEFKREFKDKPDEDKIFFRYELPSKGIS